jgi:hypothetical protein
MLVVEGRENSGISNRNKQTNKQTNQSLTTYERAAELNI